MATGDPNALRAAVVTAARPTGGWPYQVGGASRLEPTCWALLAVGADPAFDATPHWRFLTRCQQHSGLLVESPDLPPNLAFNALAAIALDRHRPSISRDVLPPLIGALVDQAGLQVSQSPNFRQDNSLRGWPWIGGTFSWVEPTAWATLALKRARRDGVAPPAAHGRIGEAERLLVDRCCVGGGWNYGNSNALGKELFPYLSTTAIALLALQDRPDLPVVERSLRYLNQQWSSERSTMGLALTALCLRRFGHDVAAIETAIDSQQKIALALGQVHAMAAALTAIQDATRDALAV